MSEQLRESMSAVMDGEADAFELRRVLDEASQDDGLREQWHRMHMVRDVLHEQSAEAVSVDPVALRAAIQQELAAPESGESTYEPLQLVDEHERSDRARPNWMGRLTGTAVAAVVAGLVVINGGFLDTDANSDGFIDVTVNDPPAYQQTEQSELPVANLATTVDATVNPMYDQVQEADRRRQDALRMLHYQTNAVNNSGAVSFVRMATFGRSRPTVQPVVSGGVTGTDTERQENGPR